MNNKKMINTAKNLDILANILGKVVGVFGVLAVFIFALFFIFGDIVFDTGAFTSSLTLNLDFIKFYLSEHFVLGTEHFKIYLLLLIIPGGITCFAVFYISTLIRKLLAPMKNGRPFESGAAEHLKKIGWIILVNGVIKEAFAVAAQMLSVKVYGLEDFFTSPSIERTEFIYTYDINFILVACAIFLLSYIFKYGQQLQQESDETL